MNRSRTPSNDDSPARVLAATRVWVDRVVVGLNLCPFAKAPQIKGQVRYVVSEAIEPAALLASLLEELRLLAASPPEQVETTLLIHPRILGDFLDFNEFLELADDAVAELELEGVLQVASFHPDYQFAGTEADDLENATNRSPYPTLHLIREESIDRAVAAIADPQSIVQANLATLERLGVRGWEALRAQCHADSAAAAPE